MCVCASVCVHLCVCISVCACPQTPLEGLYFALRRCPLHTRIQQLCLMTMQFKKWPTKFGFDWPFCPNNNFSIILCQCIQQMIVGFRFNELTILLNIHILNLENHLWIFLSPIHDFPPYSVHSLVPLALNW